LGGDGTKKFLDEDFMHNANIKWLNTERKTTHKQHQANCFPSVRDSVCAKLEFD
jgi:hypothetical protein